MTVKERMNELLEKLEVLEDRAFDHKMKDRWNADDFAYDRELFCQIMDIKKELKALGWEGK